MKKLLIALNVIFSVLFLMVVEIHAEEICGCTNKFTGNFRIPQNAAECSWWENEFCWDSDEGIEEDLAAEVEAREISDSDLQRQIDGMEIPLQELSDRVTALEDTPLQIELTGSTFINWGSSAAPEGSTLIYSGYAYASHYIHSGGSSKPIVVKPGDPGEYGSGSVKSYLYFLITESSFIPPGIAADSYIKAAVSYSETPTVIIWGTHLAPTGWGILYTGYAMGAHYTDESALGPICINSQNFESESISSFNGATIAGCIIDHAAPGDTELRNSFIKCTVCKKNE